MESRDGVRLARYFDAYQDIEIRVAESDDLPELLSIDIEAFGTLTYPDFVLRQLLDVHRDSLLVAVHSSGPCGYSLAAATVDRTDAWLLSLAVRRDCRGRGYGRALTDATLNLLRGHGVRTAHLTVAPDNVIALGLYRSVGFAVEDEKRDYLGPGEDRLLMSLHLSSAG